MDFFQVLPAGPGKCMIRGAVFGLPNASREMRARALPEQPHQHAVNNEDKWLCERVQRGLASSSYRPGPLVPARELHARVPQSAARAHSGVRLPSAPKHFTDRIGNSPLMEAPRLTAAAPVTRQPR